MSDFTSHPRFVTHLLSLSFSVLSPISGRYLTIDRTYRSEYPGRESYTVTRVLSLGDNGPAGALVRPNILETFERKRLVDTTAETLVFILLEQVVLKKILQ